MAVHIAEPRGREYCVTVQHNIWHLIERQFDERALDIANDAVGWHSKAYPDMPRERQAIAYALLAVERDTRRLPVVPPTGARKTAVGVDEFVYTERLARIVRTTPGQDHAGGTDTGAGHADNVPYLVGLTGGTLPA
ncbi:hypothetical protein EAH89_21475 [Roseomonas nepalensis]|uniref:Uncharacterized protein n=1 Tax=Muricoccus nepalensis TaxID=1854500 RepID=A0A502FJJ3_9PROT|nr:hypothetical protein [Roseomonas nepalensis]TPG49283.1 hypothetical protein EAH89_21475 [Roseomonas nepalensis]